MRPPRTKSKVGMTPHCLIADASTLTADTRSSFNEQGEPSKPAHCTISALQDEECGRRAGTPQRQCSCNEARAVHCRQSWVWLGCCQQSCGRNTGSGDAYTIADRACITWLLPSLAGLISNKAVATLSESHTIRVQHELTSPGWRHLTVGAWQQNALAPTPMPQHT